jgi:putative transcriptional regulator
MYKPREVDRENLTIMGVPFPDKETLENTASSIGSCMFEGFEPSKKSVEIIRDYVTGKITLVQVLDWVKTKEYA